MKYFKAALLQIDYQNYSIIWMNSSYLEKEDELKKHLTFFKQLLNCANTTIMILDSNEQPLYYGKKEVVEVLRKKNWKQFPWGMYSIVPAG